MWFNLSKYNQQTSPQREWEGGEEEGGGEKEEAAKWMTVFKFLFIYTLQRPPGFQWLWTDIEKEKNNYGKMKNADYLGPGDIYNKQCVSNYPTQTLEEGPGF